MLLARKGYRVLIVDRATFPSDTLSTHIVHPLGIAALARWGLLERLKPTGCPPIDTYMFDFGVARITGAPGTPDAPVAYCPRRTVLDKLLLDAAAEAGAEVREDFTVERLLFEGERVVGIEGRASGEPVTERAHVVIGADGRNSLAANTLEPERYHEKPMQMAAWYAYWSGAPMGGRFETYIRPYCGFGVAPTHDGLTMIIVGWPVAERDRVKADIERNYLGVIEQVPEFAARLRGARRESRFMGAATPNYFRKPYGAGWALVGDAGYIKDPITGQGILDAFRDAERCVQALDESFSGARAYDAAMADYQRERDEQALAMYEFTCQIAALQPPPPELQALIEALPGNQKAMDDFVRVNAGSLSPAVFLAPENVSAILAGRAPSAHGTAG
jgi:2-polyprenyl-6-methoxyphenol hydroxylase-like FAD-dependent oxidoreductase